MLNGNNPDYLSSVVPDLPLWYLQTLLTIFQSHSLAAEGEKNYHKNIHSNQEMKLSLLDVYHDTTGKYL
jgi:poly-beta-hydroxyalkanoate depolymerase